MKIGELFAGIGGASLAVGMVYPDAATAWQADLVGEAIRARRFPGAQQLVGDVREVDPARLDRVDLLTAGFPCQDLSVAGKGAGLDGARSGLYSEVLRFTGAMRPERVLIENVPALLHYLPRLSADFRALGYGLTWTVCEAADAGHPHLRRRIFVLAELDRAGRGAVEVSRAERWRPEGLRVWGTPRASVFGCRVVEDDKGRLEDQVRIWPTPTVCGNDNREGASPTSGDGIATAVRTWATATATDHKTPAGFVRQGHPPARIGEQLFAEQGKRLSPAWIEALMGYPIGWTDADLDCPHTLPAAVRGRYPVGWDRREPWPGFAWEPPRTLPDGLKVPGRVARLRSLGNAWVPAQGALALRALLAPAQASLF